MRRYLHENKRSHTFKSGEYMWLCECGAGGGHYDQSVPSQGKLYRKGGSIEDLDPEVESEFVLDTEESCEVEISELQVGQTFVTIDAEVPEVPTVEPGEESDSGEVEVAEEIEA